MTLEGGISGDNVIRQYRRMSNTGFQVLHSNTYLAMTRA
jgi:hypothetical protein